MLSTKNTNVCVRDSWELYQRKRLPLRNRSCNNTLVNLSKDWIENSSTNPESLISENGSPWRHSTSLVTWPSASRSTVSRPARYTHGFMSFLALSKLYLFCGWSERFLASNCSANMLRSCFRRGSSRLGSIISIMVQIWSIRDLRVVKTDQILLTT